MQLYGIISRGFHLGRLLNKPSSSPAVNKAALSSLRKKTGYTFANCKKALEQFGDDLTKAETWLREQAQKEGWAQATKLQNRLAAQGLIGVKYKPEDGTGVLVEVNCETDFVARNAKFHDLVTKIADACIRQLDLKPIDGASYHKWSLTPERIASFKWTQDKNLADLTALTIGQMGENMILRRAILIKTDPRECKISGYAHSADDSSSNTGVLLGRYGALVICRQLPPAEGAENAAAPRPYDEVGRQLCQHIVGMNPIGIGSPGEETLPNAEDETQLIHQQFLADDTLTVGDVLQQNDLEVLDFVRYECGSNEDQDAGQSDKKPA